MGLWVVDRETQAVLDYSDDGSIRYDDRRADHLDAPGPVPPAQWMDYHYDGIGFTLRPPPAGLVKRQALLDQLDQIIAKGSDPETLKAFAQALKDTL